MANGKLALAKESPKIEQIKKIVTKKLYGKQKPQKTLREELSGFMMLVEAFHKVWMILPAIVIGVLSGIGAAFEVGLKKAAETYRGR
jgi:hypothetical protein